MGINLFTVYIHCTTPTPSQHSPRDQPTIVEPFKDFKVKAAACYIEPMTTESSVYGRSHAQARSRHHLVSGTVLYRTVLTAYQHLHIDRFGISTMFESRGLVAVDIGPTSPPCWKHWSS
jgi:hypothetical protein